jgi:hypothetical protein
MTIPILAVSDETDPRLHSATVRDRLGHVAMVIGCGDLPSSYLEFLADALNRPVYYVLGNHADELRRGCCRDGAAKPMGAIDLGGRVVRDPQTGLILAGFPGSPPLRRTRAGTVRRVGDLVDGGQDGAPPGLEQAAPRPGPRRAGQPCPAAPRHDREDPAHRGYEALRPFLRWFRPAVQLHGHIHLYDRSLPNEQRFEGTRVVNVFPYKELELEPYPVAAPAVPTAAPAVGRAAPLVPRRTAPGPASTEVP